MFNKKISLTLCLVSSVSVAEPLTTDDIRRLQEAVDRQTAFINRLQVTVSDQQRLIGSLGKSVAINMAHNKDQDARLDRLRVDLNRFMELLNEAMDRQENALIRLEESGDEHWSAAWVRIANQYGSVNNRIAEAELRQVNALEKQTKLLFDMNKINAEAVSSLAKELKSLYDLLFVAMAALLLGLVIFLLKTLWVRTYHSHHNSNSLLAES